MVENLIKLEKQNNIASGEKLSNLHKAAIKYAKNGIPVFPVVPNKKSPICPKGFKNADTDLSVIKEWWTKWPDANIGIPTGEITGLLVLDVDNKNGVSGSDSLKNLVEKYGELPKTRKHLTPSGGYHLIYKYSGSNVPCTVGNLGPGLDVRCNGGYIVAPPSVIDGKPYQVLDNYLTIESAPDWLVKLAVAPRVKAADKYVREGSRNEYIFKKALEFRKQGLSFKEAQVEIYKINDEKCSPPLENEEVQKTLASAYRYEVAEIPPEIEELNKIHAVVMVGGKCRILNEVTCPIFNRQDISLSTPTDFKDRYANRQINGTPLGQYWFKHRNRREYDGIVFAPGKDAPKYYNLWRGFGVEPREGDCSLYLKHIEENICSGNRDIFSYVIAWMADAVQNLDRLVGTAIVLKGKQGTGKGKFITEFGKLFGSHFTHISQSSHLTGKFNAHLKHTYILFADEACWGGDKQAEGPLKALITEPTLLIEAKGQDPITVKNHVHVMVSSNNEWVVPCGLEERRFFVIEVGEKHGQDKEYFRAIENQMNNGGREALLHYLMNYVLDGVDLRTFPKTEALLEMKMMSATPVQKFWYEKLMAGALDPELDDWNNGVILASKLQDDYSLFSGKVGIRHRGTDTELGTQLRKFVPKGHEIKGRETIDRKRYQVYKFPSLQECREYFEKQMNQKLDWPSEGVALKIEDEE